MPRQLRRQGRTPRRSKQQAALPEARGRHRGQAAAQDRSSKAVEQVVRE